MSEDDMDLPRQPVDRLRTPPVPPRLPRPLGGLRDEPVIAVPEDVLARYNARILDPATAARLPRPTDDRTRPEVVRPTVYLADKLLVSGLVTHDSRSTLVGVANDIGFALEPVPAHQELQARRLEAARAIDPAVVQTAFHTLYELSPLPGSAKAADAWEVLQSFRARFPEDDAVRGRQIGLDHLMTATKRIHGSPFDPPTAAYGRPGTGGRIPVEWSGPVPAQSPDFTGRRPVVAILDTGCGEHDWFTDVVQRNVTLGSVPLGLEDPGGSEITGDLIDPLEGTLDPDAGHGTFIAGLVRQVCPEANIVAVRVMASDGAVPEHVLLDSLTLLAVRQQQALAAGDAHGVIDVVSLSLGYYHEDPQGAQLDHLLLAPLTALAAMGVVVVAAAGNDATTRPMFPAAFTPHTGGVIPKADKAAVPVISVGAKNPDGSIALFSNAGGWVTCHRPGANVVSTFPRFDGSGQAEYRVDSAEGPRATIDPDNFASGFGIWSGTSFAAPILAAEIANVLAGGSVGSLDSFDLPSCIARGWAAVAARTDLESP